MKRELNLTTFKTHLFNFVRKKKDLISFKLLFASQRLRCCTISHQAFVENL